MTLPKVDAVGQPPSDTGLPRAADALSSSALDPRLLAYAEDAVRDLVSEMGREALAGRKDALVQRLAKAMQQAIDDEYVALAQELDTRAGGPAVHPPPPYRGAEGS